MSRRLHTFALIAAFLVPALLLAWIGLGSLREESQRTAARHREQAEAIASAIRTEVDRRVSELRANAASPEQIALRFGLDGAWLGAAPEVPRAEPAGDPGLLEILSAEIDRLQASGEQGAAVRQLELAAGGEDEVIAAWALESKAALLDQQGRRDEAQATRAELVARFPRTRAASGLVRSFAAQLALARAEPDPRAALIALYARAAADYGALDETATAEFLRGLRADLGVRVGAADPLRAELARIDGEDAVRSRLRVWRASLREGPSDWVARGAPDGWRVFDAAGPPIPSANPLSMEAPVDPARAGDGRFLAVLEREGDEWIGAALELDLVFASAIESARGRTALDSLGFAAALERADARTPAAVAREELSGPLAEYAIAVRGGDLSTFAASERKRFALTVGLVALAIATAAVGAWLTLRGVAREVEAARGKEAFVAAVTHELKTPLAAIRLFAEMQERGDVEPEKVREFGARTVQESDRLARLVDSVLDLARIEHGGSSPAAAVVDLRRLASAAAAIVERVARERGFELAVTGDDVHVRGDADALTRAVVNLLDNALKYGDQPHTIEVEVRRGADGFAELAVLDRGRGVPEAERERIFEPFHRVGSELTRDRPGAGLGLALVAKIAAAHGGRATCRAREGGGSRFSLFLPLAAEVQA